jgi:hypothetical protein
MPQYYTLRAQPYRRLEPLCWEDRIGRDGNLLLQNIAVTLTEGGKASHLEEGFRSNAVLNDQVKALARLKPLYLFMLWIINGLRSPKTHVEIQQSKVQAHSKRKPVHQGREAKTYPRTDTEG